MKYMRLSVAHSLSKRTAFSKPALRPSPSGTIYCSKHKRSACFIPEPLMCGPKVFLIILSPEFMMIFAKYAQIRISYHFVVASMICRGLSIPDGLQWVQSQVRDCCLIDRQCWTPTKGPKPLWFTIIPREREN